MTNYTYNDVKNYKDLEDLWNCNVDQWPRGGEFILLQPYVTNADNYNEIVDIYKPILALVVDGFNYDMACAIHYVKYRDGKSYYYDKLTDSHIYSPPKIEMIYLWTEVEQFIILEYWKHKPSFKEVFSAYRQRLDFNKKEEYVGDMHNGPI